MAIVEKTCPTCGNKFSRKMYPSEHHKFVYCKTSCRVGRTRHGFAKANGKKDPTYYIWVLMLRRAKKPTVKEKKWYGENGCGICESWLLFDNFLADMGPRPSPKHSIDRINNTLGYSKENCRWATRSEQALNKKKTIVLNVNGNEIRGIKGIAEAIGISASLVSSRLKRGWSINRILETKRKLVKGVDY